MCENSHIGCSVKTSFDYPFLSLRQIQQVLFVPNNRLGYHNIPSHKIILAEQDLGSCKGPRDQIIPFFLSMRQNPQTIMLPYFANSLSLFLYNSFHSLELNTCCFKSTSECSHLEWSVVSPWVSVGTTAMRDIYVWSGVQVNASRLYL